MWGFAYFKAPPSPKRPEPEPVSATLGATIAASMAKLLQRMNAPDKPAHRNARAMIVSAWKARR